MKAPHLLRVTEPPERFTALIGALEAAGLRVGWLDLEPTPEPPPAPAELVAATAAGVQRAVAVGGGRQVSLRRLRGPAVLRDLLRGHFLGCRVVLARGDVAAPRLRSQEEDWCLQIAGDDERRFTTEALIAALRRPHPWKTS